MHKARSPTPFAAALSAVASSACGSMSNASTRAAPSSAAAMREHARPAAVVDHLRAGRKCASSHSRHRAVDGMRAGAEGEARIEPHDHRARLAHLLVRGHTHSREPKRRAWKSRSHSRSQARSASARLDARGPPAPVRAPAGAQRSARSVSAGYSACNRVAGHSRTSPAAGLEHRHRRAHR
jgi:hypothetical protein